MDPAFENDQERAMKEVDADESENFQNATTPIKVALDRNRSGRLPSSNRVLSS